MFSKYIYAYKGPMGKRTRIDMEKRTRIDIHLIYDQSIILP